MRSLVCGSLGLRRCCALHTTTRTPQHLAARRSVAAAAAVAASQSEPARSSSQHQQLSSSCLYILDLLPLVYRYLPRDSDAAAAAPAPQAAAAAAAAEPQPGGVVAPVVPDTAEGFLGTLLALSKRDGARPTHMAVAVDVPGSTYRHRLYPQYKAHRRQHPPELTRAISRILAVVDALGIPILSVPGAEADDVVGTLAAKAQQDGFGSVVIMSPDKDFYQLLSPTVSVLTGGPYAELYTLQHFTAEQQLPDPQLWIDVKALMGDASDNVPGLRGVGSKTAMQLVQRLGPVERILQQLAAMPEEEQKQLVKLNKSQRAVLQSEEGRVAVAFTKELVTINTQLKAPPCQQPWSAYELRVPPDQGKRALEWSHKLGMDWLYLKVLPQYFASLAARGAQ